MTNFRPSTVVTVAINRDPTTVYALGTDPQNLPRWAVGLGSTVELRDGRWIVQTPQGPAAISFSVLNPFGVLDH